MYRKFISTIVAILLNVAMFSHNLDMHQLKLHEWNLNNHQKVKASLLMVKHNEVYLQLSDNITIHYPLSSFSAKDQAYISKRYTAIEQLNAQIETPTVSSPISKPSFNFLRAGIITVILLVIWAIIYLRFKIVQLKYLNYFLIVGLVSVGYSFTSNYIRRINSTSNPISVDSAFTPFKPNIVTHWDNNYFYVESQGIPTTHAMMTGITGWQQQVPIPQCYIGSNAWSIPLNPVIASVPVPVNPSHFSRGAIAIAVNGIAIFNPYTNTGVDAYLDGQLDNWGGHCGRADDYHYHTAPLHLYGTTSKTLPIAYGLDGYAVYGNYEPDGSSMKTLDTNHGHYGNNGVYHYHGTATAPYMIGNMVGQITEDTTHQIIPQASANPIRPAGTPLKGAVITSCIANGTNGYILSYTLNGQTYKVSYSWTSNGVYTFNFINPGGTTTSNYNGFKPCILTQGVKSDNTSKNKIQIYPNPNNKDLFINVSNEIALNEITKVSIFTSSGKVVYDTPSFTEKINTRNFQKGVYIILIQTLNTTYTAKLIIN